MSRIGKQPVLLPKGVKATVSKNCITIEGPGGKLSLTIPENIEVNIENEKILVKRKNDEKETKSLHGSIRALIFNMVKGVVEGYKKELEIVGVGYKAQLKGKNIVFNLGFSHPVEVIPPAAIKVSIPNPNRIILESIDKQLVSDFAARIRKIYTPEPYKGKGIRYVGEEVRKKLGKALAK